MCITFELFQLIKKKKITKLFCFQNSKIHSNLENDRRKCEGFKKPLVEKLKTLQVQPQFTGVPLIQNQILKLCPSLQGFASSFVASWKQDSEEVLRHISLGIVHVFLAPAEQNLLAEGHW